MNKYYNYEGFELWNPEKWTPRQAPLRPITRLMGEIDDVHPSSYIPPETDDPTKLPYYITKTNSVNDPAVLEPWLQRGLKLTILEMGSNSWISAVPVRAMENPAEKIPLVLVIDQGNCESPYWAMNTIVNDEERLYKAIEHNFIVIHVVTKGPGKNAAYGGPMSEASVLYPTDLKRTYMDVGVICEKGRTISETGFVYRDGDGNQANPDEAVFDFYGMKVLDISGRWQDGDSETRSLAMGQPQASPDTAWEYSYNRERLLHSDTGRRMVEGVRMEYQFGDVNNTGLEDWFKNLGVKMNLHDTAGLRWTMVSPLSSFEEPEKKLPIFVFMKEVTYVNDNNALGAHAMYFQGIRLAGQGECHVLFFAMEDLDSNDVLCDILKDAEKLYAVDPSRVYITGHSHNGFFSFEFARRHPDLIAAVATIGNPAGLVSDKLSGNSVLCRSDEELEVFKKYDIPVINLSGCAELLSLFPVQKGPDHTMPGNGSWVPKDFESKAAIWQRRLYYSNCPVCSVEDMLNAANSPDKATRILGIPNDRCDTLWIDGFEHYIADIKNNDGKYHLRIVGVDGIPHLPTMSMVDLSWSFVRRFARDKETLACIELY